MDRCQVSGVSWTFVNTPLGPGAAAGVPDEGGPPVQLSRRSGLVPGRSGSLTVSEKDVLVVLCAFCKLASRESSGSSDSTLNQGKLLALELLVKVGGCAAEGWLHGCIDSVDLRQRFTAPGASIAACHGLQGAAALCAHVYQHVPCSLWRRS